MGRNIRALVRGLDVLEHLNSAKVDSGQNIAAALSLSPPTAYRILGTLERCGLVLRNQADNTFRPAKGVRNLSSGLTEEAWAIWIATPILYDLQQELLWPTDLTTFENGHMVIRETTHGVSPWSIESGMVGSLHSVLQSSFGRAYLAYCPDDERADILRGLRALSPDPATLAMIDRVDRVIEATRARGYATRQREVHLKTSSIAVPLRYGERVLACMSVVWIASSVEFNQAVQQCYPALARAQERIEHEFEIKGDLAPRRSAA